MYCKNCGKEVAENAYVCVGCGVLVEQPPKRKPELMSKDEDAVERDRTEKRLKSWIAVDILLLFFTAFFWFISGNLLYYTDLFIVGFLFSIFLLGFSIVSFVFALKEKRNFNLKLTSICLFIVSVVLFIFGIILVSCL